MTINDQHNVGHPRKSQEEKSKLSMIIKRELKKKKMKQKDLAKSANMSEARISRILNAQSGSPNKIIASEYELGQIALALEMGKEGFEILRRAAYPYLDMIENALSEKQSVHELNIQLYEKELPLLGLDDSD